MTWGDPDKFRGFWHFVARCRFLVNHSFRQSLDCSVEYLQLSVQVQRDRPFCKSVFLIPTEIGAFSFGLVALGRYLLTQLLLAEIIVIVVFVWPDKVLCALLCVIINNGPVTTICCLHLCSSRRRRYNKGTCLNRRKETKFCLLPPIRGRPTTGQNFYTHTRFDVRGGFN